MDSLLARLRGGRSSGGEPRHTPGKRVYCVGDIHGRLDLLLDLHAQIRADSEAFGGSLQVVYLGDYIDRGPDSREVIDCLLAAPLTGFEAIYLLGNHEQAMLDFLDYPLEAAGWLTFGGLATLLSYGVRPRRLPTPEDLPDLAASLRERLPPGHLEFLLGCRLYHHEADYYFVHAGIRPGVALDAQDPDDQMWIRDEFTESGAAHGAVVVHGHTISPEPELLPNRIGIDTGACFTGLLTCLVLEGESRRLIQARGETGTTLDYDPLLA